MTTTTYLYGIIPIRKDQPFILSKTASHDLPSIYTIPEGDIAAIVSDSPLRDYRGLQKEDLLRQLIVHQQVVEQVMQHRPVLPVKFGTFLPDALMVQRLLARQADLLRTTLDHLAGQVQMEITVLWDVKQVFQEIAEELDIEQRRRATVQLSPDAMLHEQLVIDQLVKSALEGRRVVIRNSIASTLRHIALGLALNPLKDDSLILNAALLLDRVGLEALDETLEMLDRRFEGRLTFRRVGPLPPHSFATLEVQFFDFTEIDAARYSLGLAETATSVDIRQSYHQKAGQLYADHKLNDLLTTLAIARVTEAYKLLTHYANAQTAEMGSCRFDRTTVEQTIRVAVQRQTVL